MPRPFNIGIQLKCIFKMPGTSPFSHNFPTFEMFYILSVIQKDASLGVIFQDIAVTNFCFKSIIQTTAVLKCW